MIVRRCSLGAILLGAGLAFAALGAQAASISTITAPNLSTDERDNDGGVKREFSSTTATSGITSCGFQARFISTTTIDVQGSTSSTLGANDRYSVSFRVNAAGPWTLRFAERLQGSFRIVNGGGPGRGYTTNLTCTSSPAGIGTQLDIGEQLSGEHSGDYSPPPFILNRTGTLTGSGSQDILLTFNWETWVISNANIFGNGPEVAIRLGKEANLTDVTADDYSSPSERDSEGHFLTVTLESDEATVDLIGQPMMCQPLGGGPCTYSAEGFVNGCLGQNYTLFFNWIDVDHSVCTATIHVTNGNPHWIVNASCGGACTATRMEVSVTNDPLFMGKDVELSAVNDASFGPVTRVDVVNAGPCQGLPIPTMGQWAQVAMGLSLAAMGLLLFGALRAGATLRDATTFAAQPSGWSWRIGGFRRTVAGFALAGVVGLVIAQAASGGVGRQDVVGVLMNVPIAAFVTQLWRASRRR